MKRFFRNLLARQPKSARPLARRTRPALERLEARELMTVTSGLYALESEYTRGDFANTVAAAQKQAPVRMAPMMLTVANGTLPQGDVDVIHLKLSAGQSVMADQKTVSAGGVTGGSAQMQALDSNGSPVRGQALLSDNGFPALAFTAATTGDYYIRLSNAPGASEPLYFLWLEETGLANPLYDNGTLSRSYLQQGDGHMYASLSQNILDITGPTGYGFRLRGNWTQRTTTSGAGVSSTYTATGTVYLETAAGELPIYLPSVMGFRVTTGANPFGAYAGQVTSAGLWSPSPFLEAALSAGSLVSQLKQQFGLNMNLPDSLPIHLSIDLGSDLQSLDSAFDSAVPYFHARMTDDFSLSLGNVSVTPTTAKGSGYSGDLVIDPNDPMVYLQVSGLPAVDDVAVGVSLHGRLPFAPKNQPQQWKQGTLFGHVFTHGELNLSDIVKDVPLSVSGDMLLNLDNINIPSWQTHGPVTHLLRDNIADALHELKGLTIGVNGEIDLSLSAQGADGGPGMSMKLPALQGTAILDGPGKTVYFDGSQPSFFKNVPDIGNTPLAFLENDPATVDGAFGPNIQTVTVSGWQFFNTVHFSATFDSTHIHSTFAIDPPGLGQVVSLQGDKYYNHIFSFGGPVNLNLGNIPSGVQVSNLNLTVNNQGISGSMTVSFTSGPLSGKTYTLSGSMNADYSFDWANSWTADLAGFGSVTVGLEVSSANGVYVQFSYSTSSGTAFAELQADGSFVVTYYNTQWAVIGSELYDKAGNLVSSWGSTIEQGGQDVGDTIKKWLGL